MVRATKKSMPTMCLAWFRRNVSHRWRFSGSVIGFRIYFATVFSQTLNPSFSSSPWIRCADHVGFSLCIFRISFMSPQSILGLPTLRDFLLQYSLKPFLCQPITVGGFTIIRADFQSFQILSIHTQKIRSAFLIFGLFILRCWTSNCWRRAKFSITMPCLLLNMSLKNSMMSLVRNFNVDFSRIFL